MTDTVEPATDEMVDWYEKYATDGFPIQTTGALALIARIRLLEAHMDEAYTQGFVDGQDVHLDRIKRMDEALANIERRAAPHPDDTDEENKRQLRHILSAARAARKEQP